MLALQMRKKMACFSGQVGARLRWGGGGGGDVEPCMLGDQDFRTISPPPQRILIILLGSTANPIKTVLDRLARNHGAPPCGQIQLDHLCRRETWLGRHDGHDEGEFV